MGYPEESRQDLEGFIAKVLAADPSEKDSVGQLVTEMAGIIAGVPTDYPAITTAMFAAFDLLGELTDKPHNDVAEGLAKVSEALAAVQSALDNDGSLATGVPASAPAPAPTTASTDKPAAESPKPFILPADTDIDLLGEFRVESLEHIASAEGILLAIEAQQVDPEQVNTVFRSFHTIKGTSGFLGLDLIGQVAHRAESLLDRARSGKIRLTGGYADLSLRSCDALKAMIELLDGATPGQELVAPAFIGDLLVELADPEAAGIHEGDGPALSMRVGDVLVGTGRASREHVEEVAASQGDEPIGVALIRNGVPAADVASAIQMQKAIATGTGATEATARVSTARLDSILNMVGELVISHSMVCQDKDVLSGQMPRLARNVSHAEKIIRELQELSVSLRMVPLKATFQKMIRLTRDLARKSGKNVRLLTEGNDTEIDRNMVERLNDPLVHMIRNAVDHGIESAEDRVKAGKDPAGTVRLRAHNSAGNIVIELSDDGKGLDQDNILAKAVERGIIDASETLTDAEAFGLIFRPGFSTAKKITDVSGRGVGMDVVKNAIESLRGRVEVASRAGAGSTFTIRLPLTMAITDAMLLRVGDHRYLLPIMAIERSFRPEKQQLSSVVGQGEIISMRGELLPIFRLHRLFNIPGAQSDATRSLLIIVAGEGKRYALMVDELLGQHQIVVKALGGALGNIPGVSGAAILGDGRVGLILDPAGLLESSQGHRIEAEPVAAA